ncbi:hypothetical protein C8D95_10123 [Silicimonas algicola]|uniref:Uncharacterized protein n=1 Tax=Silicimonas algicola TaxID=1826607 RepID=A0A316GBE1_9RHOB|nr:hypothetical protein C8D95_10123 [Silicimonas algicola]
MTKTWPGSRFQCLAHLGGRCHAKLLTEQIVTREVGFQCRLASTMTNAKCNQGSMSFVLKRFKLKPAPGGGYGGVAFIAFREHLGGLGVQVRTQTVALGLARSKPRVETEAPEVQVSAEAASHLHGMPDDGIGLASRHCGLCFDEIHGHQIRVYPHLTCISHEHLGCAPEMRPQPDQTLPQRMTRIGCA